MPPIQRPDISNEIRRQFGIVGFGGPESISPEIVPVVIVQDISPARNFREASGGILQTAVVGEFSRVQLFNPNNSRTIIEAWQVLGRPSSDSIMGLRQEDTALVGGGGTARFTDRRLAGRPVGQVLIDTIAVIVGEGEAHWRTARDSGVHVLQVRYTLVPGTGVALINETANLNLRATWFWRERNQLQTD